MQKRAPSVAGTFYPDNPTELKEFCDSHLKPEKSAQKARAIILPHAGYIYSGETACRVLSRVKVSDTVVLIGPNHRGVGSEFAMTAAGVWETPLGEVAIDSQLASKFLEASHDIVNDELSHRYEHSLEVEIPLLQTKNPKLKIVPMVIGTLDFDWAKQVAHACGEILASAKKEILVVISTDMSHYESDDVTRKKDRYALEAIQHLDEQALLEAVRRYNITMCGIVPVYMLLCMKDLLGIKSAALVDYTTSADATGDKDRVVGYAGFIFE